MSPPELRRSDEWALPRRRTQSHLEPLRSDHASRQTAVFYRNRCAVDRRQITPGHTARRGVTVSSPPDLQTGVCGYTIGSSSDFSSTL